MRRLLIIFTVLLLAGCYQKPRPEMHDTRNLSSRTADTLARGGGHRLVKNYNFVVDVDSIVLLRVQPEEKVADVPVIDTFAIHKNERIVVADIRVIPRDTLDSVWVEVADERARFGWLHEGRLLSEAVPDDPISQFISLFSGAHLYLFIGFLVVIATIYIVVILRRKDAPFVHWRDIPSFYPTLLCLLTALAATLYASIQMFAPEAWIDFYFRPTLNPFATPPVLSLFLVSVWAMIIVALAVVDVVFRTLPPAKALLYSGSVGAVCVVAYILFTTTTRLYVGYPLLAAYIAVALYRYFRYAYCPYECGRCGAKMRKKGRCPHCGEMNI
ncbi:MAG: zinc ribbon domain-containing protein [Prevotella sp.]|nr:zinc ribbon domain-containing protein [Prevotella sp.]